MLPAPAAVAADLMPVKAAPVADTGWYYYGDVEFGGRFFLNNPTKDGLANANQKSLGKYYEYSDIAPGAFLNGWIGAGTKDGLYKYDLWADNVGYEDQRFELNGSKAGEWYFTGLWDQTPHIYSTNAVMMYQGLNTNTLWLPPNLAHTLYTTCGQPTTCGVANATTAQQIINSNSYVTELGIRRDTGAVEFRWTPTTNWDVNVAYSHMHRWGNQAEGIVFGPGTSNIGAAQVPKPVNDVTQNYSATGEYAGTSFWGQKFNFKVGYAGSTYTDKWNSYTVDDPFCSTADTGLGGSRPGLCGPTSANGGNMYAPSALVSLWPDNQANGFNATLGADLPMKSRYMGTLSYNMMRQNQSFLPFTNNPTPWLNVQPNPTQPYSSLNGAINTFLSNNVVTTQITPDLKSKLSYRYYNFDNNTPELLFNDWILTDTTSANNRNEGYAANRSLSVNYTKQNAGADLNWQPDRFWNLGIGYGWEHYSWTRADASSTNENQGKAFIDYKPWTWLTSRFTASTSYRAYGGYDYRGNVGNIQWADPTCQTVAGCSAQYSTAYRQFYLDDRQRNIFKYQLAVDVMPGLTVTPTFGYQNDGYSLTSTEAGLTRTQVVRGGVEAAYAINPFTTFLLSYMNEQYRQNLKYTNAAPAAMNGTNVYHADVRDTVNTFTGAINWAAIPDKLDFRLSYALSLSKDSQAQTADNGVQPSLNYYDTKGQWTRLEALAKYTFDKTWVHSMGFNGEAYAKLRYVWERNSVGNIEQDVMLPYFVTLNGATTLERMTWMAFDNPNYNVQLLAASIGLKW